VPGGEKPVMVRSGSELAHEPELHCWPKPHARPQLPQLEGSLFVLTQLPLHSDPLEQ
jgi:hypothetical protein